MSVLEELPLVTTIAVGLGAAFIFGMVATRLKLSPLVGYLFAGIAIGPHSPGFVADIDIAEQLSEIGIVLLMFGVGLHFSVQDFKEVRKIASIGALARIGLVTAAAYAISTLWWGWSAGMGIIFGLSLSVASTVVLLRTLEEHHLLATITGKIAIGWLIVEDIAMILALILVPAFASAGVAEGSAALSVGGQVGLALGKAALFAVLMIVAGKRILPWLLSAVLRTGSRELFTLAAICMAIGIAFGAAILFGVSLALGAFFAGMMIRESDLNHEIADRLLPFQDAFAVLFFVAVGMLFDPSVLIDSPLQVLVTVLLIVPIKAAVTYFIVSGFRYPRRVALKISAGLAQIGEFSFILIALGASLGLLAPEERNLILAGALISIALNPIIFNSVRRWSARHDDAPASEIDRLAHLESGEKRALKDLVLLIGHGRVGSHVSAMVDPAKTDLVILDSNREAIGILRKKGFHAVAGDATDAATLEEAGLAKAAFVLVTIPDPFEAKRVIEQVQKLKPTARIFVRSHNTEETNMFEGQHVEIAVSGFEEIARRMVDGISRA